ncbi:F-box protein SKIP22-like [Arachis stenosperma]|uniref:F-box protein SKIP22-like n=1 Tax=Arachis stenosperma TaxID=217475 RepID=UPI0025AC3CC3|nr:F-box protein SKIP22-like [Arachis stenosperma]
MLKLRVRSLESKETLKIEVPGCWSLQQLKDTISHVISSSSSSSLHLSLNRRDEIHASSPDDSIKSLGIAYGDLVFYTLNPTAFSTETQTLLHKPTPQEPFNSCDVPSIQHSSEILMVDAPSIPEAENIPSLESSAAETVDMADGSGGEEVVVRKTNSEASFVKRVLKEANGNDVTDLKLLVLTVHAVILESGFVRADKISPLSVASSPVLDEWPSASASSISLRYTLPEILTSDSGVSRTVLLKFQTLGHLVNVYGSLFDDAGSEVHRVSLDKRKFAKPLKLMLGNFESKDNFDDDAVVDQQSEIFELWKMVKDRLALPLLIDLCDKAGLDPPPCFMRLPTELKIMILERLPGVDVARIACLCTELEYLSGNNDLWRKKFEEEFGVDGRRAVFFKELFALHWGTRKRSMRPVFPIQMRQRPYALFPARRDRNPFGIPSIVGGDYDRLPGFGQQFPTYSPRRTFLPPCHRGGFHH